MTIRVRPIMVTGMLTVAALVAGCGDGGGEGDETPTPSTEPTTQATEPALTAPPTQTPEEEAEAAIKETFKTLITDLDDYYSNASDYSTDEVEANPPATKWRVTYQAEGELSNWTVAWRRSSEIEQVGNSVIANHDVTDMTLRESGVHEAQSTGCLDITGLTYQTFEGQPADLQYELDKFQTWTMTWIYHPEADSEAGIDEPGWYVQVLDLTRNQPC